MASLCRGVLSGSSAGQDDAAPGGEAGEVSRADQGIALPVVQEMLNRTRPLRSREERLAPT